MKKLSVPVMVYSLLGLYTIAPIIGMIIAVTTAQYYNCQLDVNTAQPCIVGGHDIGSRLSDLALSSCFLLLTLPTGGIALLIYTLVLVKIKASAKTQARS